MRLLSSWLRDFVDVAASPDEIAATLGLRGFEVASVDLLPGGDGVIDFEVTANRPDALSVVGLAREVATAFGLPLRLPTAGSGDLALCDTPIGDSDRVDVAIDDAALCPRYSAATADVAIGPSPSWLAARLTHAGVRPINNIVDLTNYVLLELGHPMHAFDLARLGGAALRARRARAGETVETLDGVKRTLEADMLVIADAQRAQAVAGVMGGAASEVSSETRTVAFESAYFAPASVRRTSRRLGLKTEASARFERGADVNATVVALQRLLALMERIGAGRVTGPIVDRYPAPRGPRVVALRAARLARLLGAQVPDADVARILESLGMGVKRSRDGWDVTVPTFRVDVLREADLIEEVGRHYGFDRLEPTFPAVTVVAPEPDPRIPRDRTVRQICTAAGLSEAVTFGFIEAAAAAAFGFSGPVGLANPLSAKFDTLRPSLLPGLVDAVAHNRRHGRRDVRLFEIGTRFDARGEARAAAAIWTGGAADVHWSGHAREVDVFDAKGLIETLGEALGAPLRLEPADAPYLVAGQAAAVRVAADPSIGAEVGIVGIVGILSPAVADARELPRQDRVVVAEINLDALQAAAVVRDDATHPLPRYPFVVRDLSMVVADVLPADTIRGTIQAAAAGAAAPLVGIAFFDRYQGKGVPEGSVSLSVRLTFQSANRTLTDADVQQSFDRILAALVEAHGAVQR